METSRKEGEDIMILGYMGQALMGIALVLAGLQAFGPARFFKAHRLACGQFLFVTLAFGVLLYAHITDQFSLLSVVLHSHTHKPLLYKISGVWGNHEGSMLLWVLILSGYGAALTRQVKNLEAPYHLAGSLFGFMNFGFLLFLLMACDPFDIADPIPLQGQDLNPLLQDPSLAIHPPILYLGYAGFAVPFVLAVTALLSGKMLDTWPTILRPWIMFSWTFLTLGVGLGSFWAYYELGWGGWWFWDPVENAALMPWLLATALVHTVIAVKATKTLQASTLLLSILTFSMCLFGTFLVRSGLLTSVHNFAVDPERGAFILILSSLLILPAFSLFIWRFPLIRSQVPTIPLSRSGLILLMTLILGVGSATVALGIVYPLILDALGQKITVGAPYFNATFVPMMLPLLALIGLGPWYKWPAHGLPPSAKRWLLPLLCLTIMVVLIAYLGFGMRHILGLSAFAGAVWTILSTLGYAVQKRKILSGTILGHLGIGITVLGMVGSSLGEKELITAVKVGDTFSVGPVSLTLQQVTSHKGPNYTAHQATLRLQDGSALRPEKRFYWTQGVIHGESAIQSIGLARLHHIYITLGEEYEGQKWSIHAYYKPFINFLWLGILLIVCAGFVGWWKKMKALKKIIPVLLISLQPILGVDAHEQLTDHALEKRARVLSQKIICPTCQGQILDESPIEAAAALRSKIRNDLREGQTDQQILDAFVAQYGPQIITTPPVSWSTYALWFGPWVAFLMILGGYLTTRAFKK
jgi:cytochrome c-type biogenesis protein CcmF